MLQYLRQAEIQRIIQFKRSPKQILGVLSQSLIPDRENWKRLSGRRRLGKPYAILGGFEVVFPHVEVLDVVNRGVTFPRPASHLGKPLMTTTPAGIGDLALAYLDKMIGEVESFG